MYVGLLQFDLHIHDASSLKDKRRVVKSVKDRLHREHMVAVSEVGGMELWNVARMGLAAVSSDGKHLSDVLDRVLAKLHALADWPGPASGAELGDVYKQVLSDADCDAGEVGDDSEPLWLPGEGRDE